MSPDGSRSMEEAIAAGRAQYVAQNYRQALDLFTDAIKLCPCEVEKKKRKRGDSVGQGFDENAQENQAATELPTLECDNRLHLQALSYRAGTFEKIPNLRRAQADARRMMDIAPCSPERLDKARNPLKPKFSKVDPLGSFASLSWMSKARLPGELVRMIFGRLELSTLCEQLWRSLIFTGASAPRKALSFNAMRKLLSHSLNDIRELVIDDAYKFGLDQRKFNAVLSAGTKLERLELTSPCEALDLTRVPGRLTHLRLGGFHRFYRPNYAGRDTFVYFLLTVASTLESLSLAGIPRQWLTDMAMPIMTNLRHLRLIGDEEQPWSLSVVHLLRNTPQLEQLYLDDVSVDCRPPDEEPFDNCCVPNLKSLTIIDRRSRLLDRDDGFWIGNINEATIEAYKHLVALSLGKKLKALQLRYTWECTSRGQAQNDIFSHMYREDAHAYENLEVLRLSKLAISPRIARRLFELPIRAGKLRSFDIVFPLPTLVEAQGQSSADHLQKYQWLEGAESIRCIGLYDFSFKSYINAWDHPLVKFLQKFPCLEELKLASTVARDYEFLLIVEDVLASVKLKTIYASQLTGSSFDKIRRLARKLGVTFVWERKATEWPVNVTDN
ncbi:hypothetical protein Trco_006356 [Trichoderma cornu-damae]|uniref:F-box domain-containing protein n=1 Tax=Trichoderma cornu-damae TaxID=654480 RepID=A0A9P8QGV9_9HYPO|nr:hypothetical protein Trco_006356 [Trichoderma cornu-damae]